MCYDALLVAVVATSGDRGEILLLALGDKISGQVDILVNKGTVRGAFHVHGTGAWRNVLLNVLFAEDCGQQDNGKEKNTHLKKHQNESDSSLVPKQETLI